MLEMVFAVSFSAGLEEGAELHDSPLLALQLGEDKFRACRTALPLLCHSFPSLSGFGVRLVVAKTVALIATEVLPRPCSGRGCWLLAACGQTASEISFKKLYVAQVALRCSREGPLLLLLPGLHVRLCQGRCWRCARSAPWRSAAPRLRVGHCMTCPAKYVCAAGGRRLWVREAQRRAAAVAFALVNSWPSPLETRQRSLPPKCLP